LGCKGKRKVVPVLSEVPHHEDIFCLTRHHAMKTYGRVEV